MRINEDYMEVIDHDDIANDRALSMDVRQNVEWLLAGEYSNIDFNVVDSPIYKPKDRKELLSLIRACVKKYETECSLNWIDVSEIRDFSDVFYRSKFNGDISKWDVSQAVTMHQMFAESEFNGDLSSWDVSNVKDMSEMFASSKFNNDSIVGWDVSNVRNMESMFLSSDFNCDITGWDVSNVTNMEYMFYGSKFKYDISVWF